MKRLFMIILFGSLFLVFAFATQEVTTHFIMGYIDSSTSFSVNILNEVLPFDLESKEVAMTNSNIKGIRIGTFSLLSNTKDFRLYAAHTPLVWDSTSAVDGDTKTETSIDYRLYMIVGNEDKFKSALSYPNPATLSTDLSNDENVVDTDTYVLIEGADSDVWPTSVESILSIVNQSIYVRLEVPGDVNGELTAQRVEDLKAGSYKSDIYFYLENAQ